MEFKYDYTTKNNIKIDKKNKKNKYHIANIELADRIKYEISHFFDINNKKTYSLYFSEEQAERFRTSSYGKKNAAITALLSEELNMSEKTFYHMQSGNNSQFDKIVGVLDFFGLSFRYDIFLNEENVIENKQELIFKERDGSVSDLEAEIVSKILSLDEESLLAILPTINQLAKISSKNKDKKVIYKK